MRLPETILASGAATVSGGFPDDLIQAGLQFLVGVVTFLFTKAINWINKRTDEKKIKK